MNEYIVYLGRNKTVAIITTFSVISSLIITAIAMHLLNTSQQMIYTTYIIAAIVPLIIAPIVGLILVNALLKVHSLEKEMRELATVDYLTKLLSRRAWMQQAEKYIHLASHTNNLYAILMIDVDDFKAVNDQYGHAAGDKVLINFGKIVSKLCRSSDFSARFGGEEFVILLTGTTIHQAEHFTARLRKEINDTIITHENKNISFTVSIGITTQCTNENYNIDRLISQSDLALYQAKQKGKNRACVFNPDSELIEHPQN